MCNPICTANHWQVNRSLPQFPLLKHEDAYNSDYLTALWDNPWKTLSTQHLTVSTSVHLCALLLLPYYSDLTPLKRKQLPLELCAECHKPTPWYRSLTCWHHFPIHTVLNDATYSSQSQQRKNGKSFSPVTL